MATPSARTRLEAHTIPPTNLVSQGQIRFLHPGYAPPNTLLSLARVDRVADTATFGVNHRTAVLACQIIANNAFDTGRLTLDKAGQQPVQVPLDGILTEKIYYFVVGNSPSMGFFLSS